MAKVTGTKGNDTILVGSASKGVVPPTGATDEPDDIWALDGADTVIPGRGNDKVWLGTGHDLFVWNPGDGSDTANGEAGRDTHRFNGSDDNEIFKISNDGAKIELLRNLGNIDMDLSGFERIELIAKGGHDYVDASGLTNPVSLWIDGGAGNDTINGSANADTILGGAGHDTLKGGIGADKLTGGAGHDRFDYDSVLDSGIGAGKRDIIHGFDFGTAKTGDKIDLSTIDANETKSGNQAFKFIGVDPFSAPGQVNVFNHGGSTIIQLNTDFDLFAESQIQVNDGATVAAFWEAIDFIL